MRATLLVVSLCASASAAAEPWVDARKIESFVGAHATDYSTVQSDRRLVGGIEGSLLVRPPGRVFLQLDLVAATFAGQSSAWIAAPRVAVPWSTGLVAASYTFTNFPSHLVGHRLSLDGRLDETPWLSVVASAGYDALSPGENLLFGELFLHMFPSPRWAIESGFSYAHARIKQTRADIVIRAEYTAWIGNATSLALFATYGGNLLTKAQAGLTVYFDALPSAVRARERGISRARLR